MIKLNKGEQKGVTLIALMVTIIILLILARISIAMLTGNNSLVDQSIFAREGAEVSNEKEFLSMAISRAVAKNSANRLTQIGLQNALDYYVGEGKTEVLIDEDESGYVVQFIKSGRFYQVSRNEAVTMLGKENELKKSVTIAASPESNTTPKLVQLVDLTVKTAVPLTENDTFFTKYGWSTSNTEEPEAYTTPSLLGTSKTKTTTVSSVDTDERDYYLWVKVELNDNEIKQCFGPYSILEHTTLVSDVGRIVEGGMGGFLGGTTRNKIESVTFTKDSTLYNEHMNLGDYWDVSSSQNKRFIAWKEDEDKDDYWEVTIASDGKDIIANADSSYLFSYIGRNGDSTNVFNGLENLNTELVTNMSSMFEFCTNAQSIDVSNFNTSNVINMSCMFLRCLNLINLDISSLDTERVQNMSAMFGYGNNNLGTRNTYKMNLKNVIGIENLNTENVTDMSYMFSCCRSLSNLDLSKWDVKNVNNMSFMFGSCSGLEELNLSGWNTGNVQDMSYMFGILYNDIYSKMQLKRIIGIENFDTRNVTTMECMFSGCIDIEDLNLSGFNTSKVNNISGIFSAAGYGNNKMSLKNLNLKNFDLSLASFSNELLLDVPKTVHITTNSTMAAWITTKFPAWSNNITIDDSGVTT